MSVRSYISCPVYPQLVSEMAAPRPTPTANATLLLDNTHFVLDALIRSESDVSLAQNIIGSVCFGESPSGRHDL